MHAQLVNLNRDDDRLTMQQKGHDEQQPQIQLTGSAASAALQSFTRYREEILSRNHLNKCGRRDAQMMMHGIALHMHRHGEPHSGTPMHLERAPSSHTHSSERHIIFCKGGGGKKRDVWAPKSEATPDQEALCYDWADVRWSAGPSGRTRADMVAHLGR